MPALQGLGKALRWLRTGQDRRQYEVASDAGVTKAMLSAYETGKQRPALETLEKILDALGVDLADLHHALLIVNDRATAKAEASARERWRRGPDAAGPRVDVSAVLGLDHPLPPAEEAAFAEMLGGFHRLLRYMHRSLGEVSPARPGRRGGDPDAEPS
jgi:transcriptional regulator with XRE-family HTH domain